MILKLDPFLRELCLHHSHCAHLLCTNIRVTVVISHTLIVQSYRCSSGVRSTLVCPIEQEDR